VRQAAFAWAIVAALGCNVPAAAGPRVRLETSAGAIVIDLDETRAPITAKNFLDYVTRGYYDGTIFHRVIPGFIVQGGGYDAQLEPRQPAPPIFNESGNGLGNLRGTIGMGRANDPHSANSQFYFNLADNRSSLDPKPTRWGYAVFGVILEGLEVAEAIANTETIERKGLTGVPPEPVVIKRVVVEPGSSP